MADAVELDPVGVRQPVLAEARGGGRPRQQPVVGPPHDPHRAGDPLGVELASPRATRASISAQRAPRSRATPSSWWASSSAGMCSKLAVSSWSRGAGPPGGEDRVGVRRGGLRRARASPPGSASRSLVGVVARAPSRRPAPARRPSPPARARRAAARRSRRASCRRGARARTRPRPSPARPRRRARRRSTSPAIAGPARVPGQRQREHVVPALERGQHELPHAPRVGEAVQQHQRRPGAAAMRRRERRSRRAHPARSTPRPRSGPRSASPPSRGSSRTAAGPPPSRPARRARRGRRSTPSRCARRARR